LEEREYDLGNFVVVMHRVFPNRQHYATSLADVVLKPAEVPALQQRIRGSPRAAQQSAAGDAGPSMLSPTTGLRAGPAPVTLVSFSDLPQSLSAAAPGQSMEGNVREISPAAHL
jgi:hypothetical protein